MVGGIRVIWITCSFPFETLNRDYPLALAHAAVDSHGGSSSPAALSLARVGSPNSLSPLSPRFRQNYSYSYVAGLESPHRK